MELKLERFAKKPDYTIGRLYIDGEYFCDTIEDTDRGLSQTMPASVVKSKKRHGATAIPTGRYRVTLDVKSPRFSGRTQYAFCGGYLPRLINVPAFDGVLIHIGNSARDTEGCILVGRNTVKGMVTESTIWFKRLYQELLRAEGNIYITIV